MEKKNIKLKNNFSQLIAQVSKFYKDISSFENDSYNLGKKEAYEEILNWYLTVQDGDLKNITAGSLYNMLQEKISKIKLSLNEEDQITTNDIKSNKKKNSTDEMIVDSVSNINSNDHINQPIFSNSIQKKKKFK